MRGQEKVLLATNAAPGTFDPAVSIRGGHYLCLASVTGVPALQLYQQDGQGNWVAVGAAFTTSGGGSFTVFLAPGMVRAIVGTSTANFITLVRIPSE